MSVNTLSGREAARAHRQGQKSGRSTGSRPTRPTAKVAPVAKARAESASAPAATPTPAQSPARRPVAPTTAPVAVAGGREAARKARQQQKTGKVSRIQSTPNPHPKAKAKMKNAEPIVQPREKTAKTSPSSSKRDVDRRIKSNNGPIVQSGGRNASRAFRQAGSKGKAAQAAFKSKGTQSGAVAKMANPDASTREIARKVRAERCTKGKQGCVPAESSGARRRQAKAERNSVPQKVGETSTLSGQSVTGTQVGQGPKVMTGAETGACKLVSGTEYLGAEEFSGSCDTQPIAAPAKVTQTQTTFGQIVSGTGVGSSEKMTGDEPGQCSAITGTEYIPADQSELFCGADAPAKATQTGFSIMSQPAQQADTSKVTGGDNYKSQSTTIRPSTGPTKVVASMTAMGQMTTGTQVGRLADVTGIEAGSCKNVSGTGYQSSEETEACGVKAEPTPIKVTASATSRGQIVTGDRSGGNDNLTGAEAGACQAITGTGYMGSEHVKSCSTDQQTMMQQRQRQGINQPVTGVQPGPQGLTGAQKGACELVTGSHYQGTDQTSMMCDSSNAAMPGQSDFPQMMGSQMPMQTAAALTPAPVAPTPTPAPAEVEQGAGRITGDGWDRSSKVTGTEGPWAAQRNSSIRGASGQSPMGAAQFRPAAMEEVPQSPITGSSGNTEVGAKVTLSGGARA